MTRGQAVKIARACPTQVELGDCSQAQLSDWILAVNAACCDDPSNCAQGYPVGCDVACATVFRPTFERCVEPNLNDDGTPIVSANGIGDQTAQMIADAFRSALAGVPPEAWTSLGDSCPVTDGSDTPPPPTPGDSSQHAALDAKIFNVNFNTHDFDSNKRRLQANTAQEIQWDTSASAVVALSDDVPACTPDRKGYFLAATIDLKDTMLFCAHNNGKMAWEGFSGLGGFFGQSLSALYEQITNRAAGTFFVTLAFDDMEQAEGTVQVSNAQTCFIAGNSSAPDLAQWASGDTEPRILPELKGPSNVAALQVTNGGILRIEEISVRRRTSSTGPAGLHVQSGGQATIDKCSFENLRTVAREGQSAAVVAVESDGTDISAVLTISTSRFVRCGPIAVWSARPLHVSGSLFIQNGGPEDISAAISMHNASGSVGFTVSNCEFRSNSGDGLYVDAAHVVLSGTNFSTDTDLQGTAARLRRGGTVDAAHVKINKYSEFDLGADDVASFTHCQVENSVVQQNGLISMQQACNFDASEPSKMVCRETDETSTFHGPVKVENQVHLQFEISENTEPLHLIKVRTGYTLNISGSNPSCRDDPSGVLAKFASTDPSGTTPGANGSPDDPRQFCRDVKQLIEDYKVRSMGLHSELDCNQTLGDYDLIDTNSKFFKGLFSTRHPFDSGPYAEAPYTDDTRRNEYRNLKIVEVCRATCNQCDGFVAQAHPSAADLEPRFLVDAVFDIEQGGKLSLYNVAIRDGYNMGEEPSFEDFGNPTADPPVPHPAYAPPTAGSPLWCGECPSIDSGLQAAFIARANGMNPTEYPQPYTPRPCPPCHPTDVGSGRPVPAVNIQPGGVLEARFSQLSNPTKPEWGWLVRSCRFQKRTGDVQNMLRTNDVCQPVSNGVEQRGVYTDTQSYTDQSGPAHNGECSSVLSVGPDETISMTLKRNQNAYDGTYILEIYDGDQETDQRIYNAISSSIWANGDVVNVSSSTSNKVLIKRKVIGDSGTAPDWELHWGAHWELDFSCTPVPPSDQDSAPLMGPATIGKEGVKFVKVDSSEKEIELGSATVRQSERVIIFGDTEDRDHLVTVNTKFIVEEDASLTIKNMKIDARSASDDTSPALEVNMNASITVQNCDVLSSPAIRLPSGDFSFQSTTLYPFRDPVTWNSGSINFLFQSWSQTAPLTQTIWIYERVAVPNDGIDSMNNTLLVSTGQDIALQGPRADELHVVLEGYVHVRTGGSVTIQYIRLRAPEAGAGLSTRPANALVTVEQDAWASFQSVQRLHSVLATGEHYSWIVQDWQNYGVYKVVGRSSTGSNSMSSLNITGPRYIGQNTSVVRLFSQQQDMVGGVISLRQDGLFGPDPLTTEETLLSEQFELLDRSCAIFIGLCTHDGRNDMTALPDALELGVPGAYYVRWQREEDMVGIVRALDGISRELHVHNGQHLLLTTSTATTLVQVDGTQLTVDQHASLQTQRINFPALNPANVFVYGRVDTDACFMVTMDQRNTIGDNADWRCIDDPMMRGNTHCHNGYCAQQDTTSRRGSCGDHVVQLSDGEMCDSGVSVNSNAPVTEGMDKDAVCRPNCQKARCGDGVVDLVDEQCDLGDANFVCDLAASVDTTRPGFDLLATMYPSLYTGMCDHTYCGEEPISAQLAQQCVETWTPILDPNRRDVCQDTNPNCELLISGSVQNPCLKSSGLYYDRNTVEQCRTTCKRYADEEQQPDPSICVAVNSFRPDYCRPNCQLPKCGDGVRDNGDPGDPEHGIEPLTRWQPEECDPGDPERGIPADSPTGMCSPNCIACTPENDDPDRLSLAMQDNSYVGVRYNISICGDLRPFSLPTVSIPSTHEVGIVCIEQNCQTRKVSAHFDVAGSLYLRHIEISAQTAPSGGAVAMVGATAKAQIENSKFQNNQATPPGNGGALAVSTGFVTVESTEFSSNSAAKGGAVFVDADGAVTMTNVVFRGNSATQAGGAICFNPPPTPNPVPTLVLHAAVFQDNTANVGQAIQEMTFVVSFDNGDAPADAVYPSGGH